ncbi:glycosyltransferase family protein [Priestia megaterium]|uniref:glycosyltransferase n=1 Tax=Priestia megaterium TaxID=1404 RepID=UPI002220E890|nr:hypothetical protein OHU75_18450 [Priestia megaterium]
MKVVIANCFETYEDRVDMLKNYFLKKGYEVSVIQSDFLHFSKKTRKEKKENYTFVKSLPYYKNLSLRRMASHYHFSYKVYQIIKRIKPDIVYALAPPNSLLKFGAKYRQLNPNTKFITDIIDLWPETMPISKYKDFFLFKKWGELRDKSLERADLIVTECDLYIDIINNHKINHKIKTLYLAKTDSKVEFNDQLNSEELHIAYLGSVNNIIDIECIKQIVNMINKYKHTTLHLIGNGETKDLFIREITQTGAKLIDYGVVYNKNQKKEIFDKCHFGINIMKESVCVGLTMKSIDYFQFGLPIINSIVADTKKIVEQEKVGINITDLEASQVVEQILNLNHRDINMMKKNAHSVFEKYFSEQAFEMKLDNIISNVLDLEMVSNGD